MPESKYGFEFKGKTTESLEVISCERLQRADTINQEHHQVLIDEWRRYLGDAPTVAGVLELTDNGALKLYQCRVLKDGERLEIYTGSFGDTLAGLVLRDGARLGCISDCEIRIEV